jgi:hypothetical protein
MAPVLRTLLERQDLPDRGSPGFDLLINLLALITTRVPRLRSVLQDFMGSIARHMAHLTVASPHAFRSAVDSARKAGADLPEDREYEAMRKFIEGDHYRVEVDQSWLVGQILQSIDILLPLWPDPRNARDRGAALATSRATCASAVTRARSTSDQLHSATAGQRLLHR